VSPFNINFKKDGLVDDSLTIHFLGPCLGFQICFTPPMFGGQCHHHQQQKKTVKRFFLVGGFNPFEKYESKWIYFPFRGENKKHLNCHHPVFFQCRP